MLQVEFRKWITREQVQDETSSLFIFGDNLLGVGYGGQAAAMRGETNAKGIPTKREPTMNPDAFFSDQPDEVDAVLRSLSSVSVWFNMGKFYDKIVWPADGIGTGLAKLDQKSPYIASMIRDFENWLRQYS